MRYELVAILPRDWKGRVVYKLAGPMTLAGVTVPAGFESDGASVPRWAWPLFPPVGRYFAAAVVHDYLLWGNAEWTRANAAFRRALVELDISGWRLFLLVASVRIYGWWQTWRL